MSSILTLSQRQVSRGMIFSCFSLFIITESTFGQKNYVEISVIEENWCTTNKPNYVHNCINEKDLFMSRMIFYSEGKDWYSANNKITASNIDSSICGICPKFNDQFVYLGENLLGKVKINKSLIGFSKSYTGFEQDNLYNLATAFKIIDQKNVPKVINYTGEYSSAHSPATYRLLISTSKEKRSLNYSIINNYLDESFGSIYNFILDSFISNRCVSSRYTIYDLFEENLTLTIKGLNDSANYSISSVNIALFYKYYKACDSTLINLREVKTDFRIREKVRPDLWRSLNNSVFFTKGKEVKFLDSDLTLVDYGDYNGDGKIEWIFQYKESFYDAYAMYYNDFNSRVECGWSGHNNFNN